MKKILTIIFCFSFLISAHAETVDKIIAKVGSEVITLSDVAQAVAEQRSFLFQKLGDDKGARAFEEFKNNALNELILQKVLAAEIKSEGIQVTDAEVDLEFRSRLTQYHMNDAQLGQELAKQGLTLTGFKNSIRQEIEKQRFIQKKIMPRVNVADYDLQQEYTKHQADYQVFSKFRFIEVMLTPDKFSSEEEVMKVAKQIEARLKANQSATDLIKKYSSGAFATTGGDSGLVESSSLRTEIQGVLSQLNVGQTSPIFPSQQGVFIFKLVAKADPKPQPFGQVVNQIRARYGDKMVNEELKKYLMAAKDQTYVEVMK